MSRVTRGQTAPSNSTVSKYHQSQLTSVSKMLQSFISNKQKGNQKCFLQKVKAIKEAKNRSHKMMLAILRGLFTRKQKSYSKLGFRKLWENVSSCRKAEGQAMNNKKLKMKNSSANFIALIYKKLEAKTYSSTLSTLRRQSSLKNSFSNFKTKHMIRILVNLYLKKCEEGLRKITQQKIKFLMRKMRLIQLAKIFNQKTKYHTHFSFIKLNAANRKKTENPQQKISAPVTKSQVKLAPKTQPSMQAEDTKEKEKQKELEDKNRALKQEIEKLKKQNEKILQDYRNEISGLEKEHQELKFNNELLDEANRELETELLHRQNKSRKKMSNAKLWDHVYSNLLLFAHLNEGKTMPKEKILQNLETPLAHINVDLDALRMENQILSELLEEYKKFYQGSQPTLQPVEDLLPFDILTAKSRFLYGAAQTLISQGLGTESEVKQLESDLDNICKHG